MSITIAANIASLSAQRRLGQATQGVETALSRLSSGQRINTAADDAAGLAIADSLKNQTRLANAAVRNANYGVSAIAVADSGLDAITGVLTRMAELAEQSANGVYSLGQRSPLQAEFAALASEIERIAITTKFNKVNLLSNGSNIVVQVGFKSFSTSQITIAGVRGTLQSLALAPSGSSALTYSINGATTAAAQVAARTALAMITQAIDAVGTARGTLGAAESRLSTAINNLEVAKENFASAEGRIRDADIAGETANLLRYNIVQQSAAAVLAQANQQPQLALKLLAN
ncbi:MAG: flagellin FliC [Oligoflexia bacterium]|nr:flagellin FliC [Oligoflexia bacterium]